MRFSVGPYLGLLIYREDYYGVYAINNGFNSPVYLSDFQVSNLRKVDLGLRFSFSVMASKRLCLNTTFGEGFSELFAPVTWDLFWNRFQTWIFGVSWRIFGGIN